MTYHLGEDVKATEAPGRPVLSLAFTLRTRGPRRVPGRENRPRADRTQASWRGLPALAHKFSCSFHRLVPSKTVGEGRAERARGVLGMAEPREPQACLLRRHRLQGGGSGTISPESSAMKIRHIPGLPVWAGGLAESVSGSLTERRWRTGALANQPTTANITSPTGARPLSLPAENGLQGRPAGPGVLGVHLCGAARGRRPCGSGGHTRQKTHSIHAVVAGDGGS